MNWNDSENGESKSSGVNGVNNYAVCIFAFALKDLFFDFRIGVGLFRGLCIICIDKICLLHICKADCYDTIGPLSERDVLPYLCMTWND